MNTDKERKKIGNKVKKLMDDNNFTASYISSVTGLSRNTIIAIREGRGGTIDSLIKILKICNPNGDIYKEIKQLLEKNK